MRIDAGRWLVAAQMMLIAALAWHALAAFAAGAVPAAAWPLAGAGLALGVATLRANRPGNFNIRPEPRAGGKLVEHGPYRLIRHPMYSCVLLFGIAAALAASSALAWAELALLAAVLFAKASIEERAMTRAHPRYGAYRARTKRFVPWLF